jgi:hypothetical protein
MKQSWWRSLFRIVGWAILLVSLGAAASLTGWSLLALLGIVPPPAHALTSSDLASMAVAGATLLLATVTVTLALFTRGSLALGRAELTLAEKSLKAVEDQASKQAEQVAATLTQAAAMQEQVAATQKQVGATQEQVTATQSQVAIARQTLEAGWRPFLVDVPWDSATRSTDKNLAGTTDAATVYVRADRDELVTEVEVPLRNIGLGPALITKAGLSLTQLHADATSLSSAIVAVSEIVVVGFKIPRESVALRSGLAELQPFVVTVFFTDQGGTGTWRTRIYLHKPQDFNQYVVERVELYEGDENTPFASTRPLLS